MASPNRKLALLIQQSGWTQGDVAERVNREIANVVGRVGCYTDERIRRLLRGEVHWPQEDARQAFMRVFHVDLDGLGFYPSNQRHEEDDVDLSRLNFLRATGASAALSVGAVAFPTMAQEWFPRREATIRVPRWIDEQQVQYVLDANEFLQTVDFSGAPLGWRAIEAEMDDAVALLEANADESIKRDMKAAVAALADTVGWMKFDAGYYDDATGYFKLGLGCAEAAGDWSRRAEILSDMARMEIYRNGADNALTLLGMARVREDRLTHLRRANLCAVQARAYGALGNVQECIRAVRAADEHFHEALSDGEPDYDTYAGYYTHAQLNGDTGNGLHVIAMRGHVVNEAQGRLATAAAGYGDANRRSRGFCFAKLAELQLTVGDPDEGVANGARAIEDARRVRRSRRLQDDILAIQAAATQDTVQVRGLRAEAALIVGGGAAPEAGKSGSVDVSQ